MFGESPRLRLDAGLLAVESAVLSRLPRNFVEVDILFGSRRAIAGSNTTVVFGELPKANHSRVAVA